mmetsp:Transcript_41499/g.163319  ORF Transcript_41499/g.163319 Transcript_41499/m.163319 type:complete len:572 (-) Transcript_41499:1062-2777(-)|eukprot:CAMPEP_0113961668 /NCGR_PEP_ID=MMETSP0011_2-20120614/5453_1 /TAXON_ID=101924 /ORGANISM="Rhodosorus marinus" /LENGTH=571 /DNA_ID=CAMNT_0000973367 /DNA_START=211 /DNA_END=1926 /DNA_ORIENTATION=+ /assembly_acc=CAM_ASM_000156
MGKGTNGSHRHGTPRRSAGLPRRLDDDFVLSPPGAKIGSVPCPAHKVETPIRTVEKIETPRRPLEKVEKVEKVEVARRPQKRQRTSSTKHSAFFESSWPRSSAELWSWDPLVHHFDDISEHDLNFLRSPLAPETRGPEKAETRKRALPSGNEPLGIHYSCAWLVEDSKEVNGTRREPYSANAPVEFDKPMLPEYVYTYDPATSICEQHDGKRGDDGRDSWDEGKPEQRKSCKTRRSRGRPRVRPQVTDSSDRSACGPKTPASPVTDGSTSCGLRCCCPEENSTSLVSHLSVARPGRGRSGSESPVVGSVIGNPPHLTRSRSLQSKSTSTSLVETSRKQSSSGPTTCNVKLVLSGTGRDFNLEASYKVSIRLRSRRRSSGKVDQPVEGFAEDLIDYKFSTPGAESDQDELREEIQSLRRDLLAAGKAHRPLRDRLRMKAKKEVSRSERTRKLVEEERSIIEELLKLKQAKARVDKNKETALPRLEFDSPTQNGGKHSPYRMKKRRGPSLLTTKCLQEFFELKKLRDDLRRIQNLADLCYQKELVSREATETLFQTLKARMKTAGDPELLEHS